MCMIYKDVLIPLTTLEAPGPMEIFWKIEQQFGMSVPYLSYELELGLFGLFRNLGNDLRRGLA